jgi:hypothetical protein
MKNYLVIFYDDNNKAVLVKSFTEKQEAEARIRCYKGGYNVMLHEIEV